MKAIAVLGALSLLTALPAQQRDYPVKPVPFTAVHVNDGFWAPRIETNRTVTIPFAFDKDEETGRVDNFIRAAKALRGEPFENHKYPPYPFDDTDVYKVIEGASYTLSVHPDPKLDAYIDGLIEKIGAAQEKDGYLYTARTIDPLHPHPWCGKERWVLEGVNSHELYDLGHLYEAAVAHYAATGKRTLLDIALRTANLLCDTFGPGKREIWPGHQIVEMGLAKLYRVTGDLRYLNLAKFMLDVRGPQSTEEGAGNPYVQAQMKVVDQTEAVTGGHAVRAMYMYSGMADVAALTGDMAYVNALDKIWDNVAGKKLHITGGIGARAAGESFGADYELPNMSAYNETCAAVGNDYWNHRLFLLHADAKYIDVMERTLYNGLISGVSLDGKTFFYQNPLEATGSAGKDQRSPWFGVACCPGNITRFMASVPGYVYAQRNDAIWVNLYVANTADIKLDNGRTVKMTQETRYPWDGAVKMTVTPDQSAALTIHVRIPGWARNEPVPSDLYRLADRNAEPVVLKVNGKPVPVAARQRLRHAHAHLEEGRHDRTRHADAGAPRAGERSRGGRPRPRGDRARTHRVRRRVGGQSQRQGAQSDASRQRQAYCRVPARTAERRGSGHRQGGRAGLRCAGSGGEARAGFHDDSLLRVGQSRPRPDDGVDTQYRVRCPAAALPHDGDHRQGHGFRPTAAAQCRCDQGRRDSCRFQRSRLVLRLVSRARQQGDRRLHFRPARQGRRVRPLLVRRYRPGQRARSRLMAPAV